MTNSIITGTGSYIPAVRVPNRQFLGNEFYDASGTKIPKTNEDIVTKLQEITCIRERRYVDDDLTTSDMAYLAAENALNGIDRESLDYIIVAQNLGDVKADNITPDMVPAIAARVKHKLRIKNPYTVAFDIPFGCPGWLQGMITADYYIRSGDAKKVMVIGAETLSRVSDPHDVDCMIYSDGAGATVMEASEFGRGVLSHVTRCDTYDNVNLLTLGKSYHPGRNDNELFVKMHGHDIYKYAVRTVPDVVKQSLDQAGLTLSDVRKVLIHQANQKMDEAILERIFKLYGIAEIPEDIMPMTISWLGNSSVATLPTMLDLLQNGKIENHAKLRSGDIVVFASVGAGMNINSMVYQMP
jgi:3-oxoacyl-[acyl-carrier-protein] synthase III